MGASGDVRLRHRRRDGVGRRASCIRGEIRAGRAGDRVRTLDPARTAAALPGHHGDAHRRAWAWCLRAHGAVLLAAVAAGETRLARAEAPGAWRGSGLRHGRAMLVLLVTPALEETLFRGLFVKEFRRFTGPWRTVTLTALLLPGSTPAVLDLPQRSHRRGHGRRRRGLRLRRVADGSIPGVRPSGRRLSRTSPTTCSRRCSWPRRASVSPPRGVPEVRLALGGEQPHIPIHKGARMGVCLITYCSTR